MTGLVSKGRRERKDKMKAKDTKTWEETKQKRYGATKKKQCPECEQLTNGYYRNGRDECPKCAVALIKI
ncbi:MAG TPA: hypothetical protein VMV95_03635 [Bacillota bacterium]|nr:hypothetical protein [Bacillota bacterium]